MIYKREAKILRLLKKNKPIPKKLSADFNDTLNLVKNEYITRDSVYDRDKGTIVTYRILPKGIDALKEYNNQKVFNIISIILTAATFIITFIQLFLR